MPKVTGDNRERQAVMAQEQLGGATPCPRPGAVAERRATQCPRAVAVRAQEGREELLHIQGQEGQR